MLTCQRCQRPANDDRLYRVAGPRDSVQSVCRRCWAAMGHPDPPGEESGRGEPVQGFVEVDIEIVDDDTLEIPLTEGEKS